MTSMLSCWAVMPVAEVYKARIIMCSLWQGQVGPGQASIPALTPGPSPKDWERGDELSDASQAPLSQSLGEGPGVRAHRYLRRTSSRFCSDWSWARTARW